MATQYIVYASVHGHRIDYVAIIVILLLNILLSSLLHIIYMSVG